jgi:hypothetical protein
MRVNLYLPGLASILIACLPSSSLAPRRGCRGAAAASDGSPAADDHPLAAGRYYLPSAEIHRLRNNTTSSSSIQSWSSTIGLISAS